MNINIYRKPKKDNLYIRIIPQMGVGDDIKIILNKKEILRRFDEDEEYWEFLVQKIKLLRFDYESLVSFIKKDKFNYCKKIKIYNSESKKHLKNLLLSKTKCFIYSGKEYQPINLVKLRENNKLYKKFENRYCYNMNYDHPDSEMYADYTQAKHWFQWFVMKYPEYHLPMELSSHIDLRLGYDLYFSVYDSEPKMDYDFYEIEKVI